MDKIGFFEEAPGKKSWMRLAASACLVFAFVIAIVQICTTGDVNETIVLGLTGLAMGAKAYQKQIEEKKYYAK